MRNSLCKPHRHWMNVCKDKVLAQICRTGAHQDSIIYTHAFETSTHIALGCNLSFFLEVLCRSRGITMTPISSHRKTLKTPSVVIFMVTERQKLSDIHKLKSMLILYLNKCDRCNLVPLSSRLHSLRGWVRIPKRTGFIQDRRRPEQ